MDEHQTRYCRFCMGAIHPDAKIRSACVSSHARFTVEPAGNILNRFDCITRALKKSNQIPALALSHDGCLLVSGHHDSWNIRLWAKGGKNH